VMGRMVKVEMTFLYQWRMRVEQFRKGGRRWQCGFNASVWLERGGDWTKRCQKMK
jgi:hypothetical protein